MATIYSDYGSGLIHPIRNWEDNSTWTGGVIPTSADTVYIKGYRTTINMTSFGPWTSTKNITVASTTGFPSSGYFYTYTNRSKKLKINYTSLNTTTFIGCIVDDEYQPFTEDNYYTGGYIINGSYVHSPAPIIKISTNITASSDTLIVETGGYVNLSGGELWVYSYVGIRDGKFIVDDGSNIRFKKLKATSNFAIEAYSLQEVIFNGNEVRTNTTLNYESNINDYRLSCSDTSSFQIGDLISVYEAGSNIILNRDSYNSTSNNGILATHPSYYSSDFDNLKVDEGFIVVDKDENYLYIKTRSGLESTVNECENIDTNSQYIKTDECRFKTGESILINKNKYEILETVEDWSLIKDCDFENGSTIDDWTTDTSLHPYSANWSVSNNLLKYTSGSYGMLLIKDVYLKEFKIEAWISPLDGYTSGNRSSQEIGIVFNADPTCARHSGYTTSGTVRGILAIEDNNNRFLFAPRYGAYGSYIISTLDSFNMRSTCRTAFKVTVEYKFPIIKFYINDIYVSEKYLLSESFTGLIGLFSNGNSRFTCQRFKVYKPILKLKINSTTNFTGFKCSQTGSEYYHSSNCKIVKISSQIINPEGHTNLAWSNAGFYDGTMKFPTINGINGNLTNISYPFYFLNNLNNVESYYSDISSGSDKYFTVDLGYPKYFTHVAYTNYRDFASVGNYLTGIQIFASNDNSTWTEIYAKQSDTRLSTGRPSLRYYSVTSGTWRYLKISVSGSSSSTVNYVANIGVFDFTNGYKITVNNASDFNVGDYITIVSHSFFGSNNTPGLEGSIYTNIANGTTTKDSYISKLKNHFTIVSKEGNTLTLSEPITNTFLNGDEYVVKVNRNIKILNDISTNYSKGNFYRNFSASVKSGKFIMNNVEISELGATSWNTGSNTGFNVGSLDPFNPCILDGISYHSSFCNYANTFTFMKSPIICRNSLLMDITNFNPFTPSDSSSPIGLFNNFILNSGSVFSNSYYGVTIFCKIYIKYNITQIAPTLTSSNNSILFNNHDVYISQNIFDGSYYCIYSTNISSLSNSTSFRVFVSKNLIRSNLGYIVYGYGSYDLFDNDSLILDNRDSSIRSMRWNYNLVYCIASYVAVSPIDHLGFIQFNKFDAVITNTNNSAFIKYTNTDFIRFYSRTYFYSLAVPNSYGTICGSNINKQSDESIFIEINFEFKISSDLYYQSSSNLGESLPFIVILQNGLEIYRQTITRKTLEYMNLYYTTQLSGIGNFFIMIMQNSNHGYIDIKSASFQTWGGTNKTKVLGNSFNTLNNGVYDNIMNKIIDTKPYKNSDNTNKITDIIINRRISGL